MLTLTINGKVVTTSKDKNLLSFLRDDLHLVGTKDGCSEGACGACTVIVDNKATKACVFKLSRLENKEVITIEGLSEREKEIYSYSFSIVGAVQCGYCTPGMIMCAKALIDQNNNPTRDDVKKAIRGNICRCTGYIKIEDAILLAAKLFRDNASVESVKQLSLENIQQQRVDAVTKAMGQGLFVDDITLEGMVYAKAIRPKFARERIISINTKKAEEDESCVKVITAKDVPCNMSGHILKDWPVLIKEGDITSYQGDAIALVVSDSKQELDRIATLVEIEEEELEGVFTIEDALKDEIKVHEGRSNVLVTEVIKRGDIKQALDNSDYVLEDTFSTPHTEHAFMEMECAIGVYNPENKGVIVYTGSQSVYDEQREISHILNLSKEQVTCKSCFVGGGFGGKEDMSVQHHAALASYLLHRPVKVKLTRQESLIVHPKRHPMIMSLRLGANKDGKITGLECTIDADTGAYASLGGPVLQRACTHASGPYNYQNIQVIGRALYTNNVPSGAFRGFGVTQSCFAFEALLNKMAEKVGLDGYQIRLINALKPGDVMPNGQITSQDTGLIECLKAVKDAYYEKDGIKGIACAFKNSGIGVGNEDVGRCILSVEGGKVHIRTSASCMGQGLATVTTLIVQKVLGLELSQIVAENPDTARTPDSGTSTASRQTVFTGEATRRAALKLKEALNGRTLLEAEGMEVYDEFNFPTDPITSTKPHPVSHLAYSYSAQVTKLDSEGKVIKITASSDAGNVINPTAIEGQVEGGVVMGMGFALTEKFPLEKGIVKSKYGTLGLLRATDVPEIKTIFVHGPEVSPYAFGAKGIGELCTIPTAPSIQNAYYNKDKLFRTSLPLEKTYYKK
ncbi:MAG: selenium-dependent xanthine dehydrogenase [Spirochaetales bacterium]|nr:selenium-dependent xanthine dehydrogenase [Spirochaetales bacterium]